MPVSQLFDLIGPTFALYPFAFMLQPLIVEVLSDHGQMKWVQLLSVAKREKREFHPISEPISA